MAKTIEEQLGEAKDHLRAMEQLIYSHLLAVDGVDPKLIDSTIQIANTQIEAAQDQGRGRVGFMLGAMIDVLRRARVATPADALD